LSKFFSLIVSSTAQALPFNQKDNHHMITKSSPPELRALALAALLLTDPTAKVNATLAMQANRASLLVDPHAKFNTDPLASNSLPGCPERPELHSHLDVPKRSPFTPEGLAALLHAVTHIEFNAINLALDAVWRFGGMPKSYYMDWLQVAAEEAQHFSLLRGLLQTMQHDYGDFAAHTGLWDMTDKTSADVLARMALVPRTLEARGLDATPPMQAKLRKVATPHALRAVEILDIILRDEISHVAIGNHWYRVLCSQRGLEPIATYAALALQYGAPRMRGPLNLEARRHAGFDEAELALLSLQAASANPVAA
jgi:uncharacterized ferritin-like protein (DUF455 family)